MCSSICMHQVLDDACYLLTVNLSYCEHASLEIFFEDAHKTLLLLCKERERLLRDHTLHCRREQCGDGLHGTRKLRHSALQHGTCWSAGSL